MAVDPPQRAAPQPRVDAGKPRAVEAHRDGPAAVPRVGADGVHVRVPRTPHREQRAREPLLHRLPLVAGRSFSGTARHNGRRAQQGNHRCSAANSSMIEEHTQSLSASRVPPTRLSSNGRPDLMRRTPRHLIAVMALLRPRPRTRTGAFRRRSTSWRDRVCATTSSWSARPSGSCSAMTAAGGFASFARTPGNSSMALTPR